MLRAAGTPACALAALAVAGCSVTPLSTTTATAEQMGEGTALVEDLSQRWLIKGSAGHVGDGATPESVWRIRYGRLELCDGAERRCRAVRTDGVLPDTLVVPRDTGGLARGATPNAVWLRALPQGAVRGGRGALAYCVADTTGAVCHAARFERSRDVLRGVIATLRLREPDPRDVAWVSLSEGLARCAASPASPEPRCAQATILDLETDR